VSEEPPEWVQAFPDPFTHAPSAPTVFPGPPRRQLRQLAFPSAYPFVYRRRFGQVGLGIALIAGALLAGSVAIAHVLDRPKPLTSNATCSADQAGVELGMQVINKSGRTLTLTGATIQGLPADLTPDGRVAWSECDLGTGDPATKAVAPGAEQWVSLQFDSDGTCPKGSPNISITYTDGSASHTETLPLGSISDLMSGIPPCD
jgi:hypothetical protein